MSSLTIAVVIFLVNIPFGFWRSRTRKFSKQWFLAVHVPIPVSIGLRVVSGLGWRLRTFPLFMDAFFCDQLAGGWLERINPPVI